LTKKNPDVFFLESGLLGRTDLDFKNSHFPLFVFDVKIWQARPGAGHVGAWAGLGPQVGWSLCKLRLQADGQ